MSPKVSRTWHWIGRHKLLLIVLAGSLLFTLGVVNAHVYKIYDSDDVAQQVNVRFLSEAGHHRVSYPTDSFIIKFPLYFLTNLWHYGTRMSLFVTVFVLAMAAYWLFVAGAYWLLRFYYPTKDIPDERWSARLLPLVLPAGLGLFFFLLFVNPNLRNIELGIAFSMLAFLVWMVFHSKVYAWSFSFESIVWTVTAGVLLGLFLYNDPYFLFMFFLPAAAVCLYHAVRWPTKRNRYLVFLTIILIGSAMSYLWTPVWAHLGIVSHSAATTYASLDAVPHNVMLALHGLFSIFNANLWGARALSVRGLTSLASFLFVIMVLYAHKNKGVKESIRTNFLHQFIVLQLFTSIGLYIFSSNAWDLASTRYFVILPFSFAILTAIVIATHTSRIFAMRTLPLLILIVIASGLAQNTYFFMHRANRPVVYPMALPIQSETIDERNTGNRLNLQIAHVIVANHLTKGYGDYWDSYVNTFFSKNKTRVIPTHCGTTNHLAVYDWSLDIHSLAKKASRTYFLFNDRADFSTSDLWCGGANNIAKQFGQPSQIIPVVQGIRLYIYDYDLAQKMAS